MNSSGLGLTPLCRGLFVPDHLVLRGGASVSYQSWYLYKIYTKFGSEPAPHQCLELECRTGGNSVLGKGGCLAHGRSPVGYWGLDLTLSHRCIQPETPTAAAEEPED